MISKQKDNPFKIDLRQYMGTDRFEAFITGVADDVTNRSSVKIVHIHEKPLEKTFNGQLSFIKRCSKIANELKQKFYPDVKPELQKLFDEMPDK